jgi:ABC-type transport system involved in cytochrome c biogenesis permease component
MAWERGGAGRLQPHILTTLAVLFLTFDTVGKVLAVAPVVEGTTALGLFTGYLGGAIATHLRVGNPLLTHILFPLYVAGLLWGGLYLRETRLRSLLPLRR